MRIKASEPSPEDDAIIRAQLKTPRSYAWKVARRCPYGFPQIVILNPLSAAGDDPWNYTALVNPLWLTCPYLNDRIHRIEQNGIIPEIQQLVSRNRDFITSMENAHAWFYYFRKELFLEISGDEFRDEMIPLFNQGIGGIRDPRFVKCLHLHYAHYQFFRMNIIGSIVSHILDGDDHCREDRCICRTL